MNEVLGGPLLLLFLFRWPTDGLPGKAPMAKCSVSEQNLVGAMEKVSLVQRLPYLDKVLSMVSSRMENYSKIWIQSR